MPDNILIETELTNEQVKVFLEQIDRFNRLNKTISNKYSPLVNENGDIVFSAGTIIHGIMVYNQDKLDSISKSGILTGQAVGISEDCETYYCADFHRIPEDISVREYNMKFKTNDGRCPFGDVRSDKSKNVAFVVVPNEMNKKLLSYDCYRDDTIESTITKSFINYMPLDKEVGSSILYGVPASCLSGIIVGGKIIDDKDKIEFLIDKFPNSYIISAFGELIYNPGKGETKDDEIVSLRREMASLKKDKRIISRENEQNNDLIFKLKEQNDKLWYEMLMNCASSDIAKVLIALNWQGEITSEYVDKMKRNYGGR